MSKYGVISGLYLDTFHAVEDFTSFRKDNNETTYVIYSEGMTKTTQNGLHQKKAAFTSQKYLKWAINGVL